MDVPNDFEEARRYLANLYHKTAECSRQVADLAPDEEYDVSVYLNTADYLDQIAQEDVSPDRHEWSGNIIPFVPRAR